MYLLCTYFPRLLGTIVPSACVANISGLSPPPHHISGYAFVIAIVGELVEYQTLVVSARHCLDLMRTFHFGAQADRDKSAKAGSADRLEWPDRRNLGSLEQRQC